MLFSYTVNGNIFNLVYQTELFFILNISLLIWVLKVSAGIFNYLSDAYD